MSHPSVTAQLAYQVKIYLTVIDFCGAVSQILPLLAHWRLFVGYLGPTDSGVSVTRVGTAFWIRKIMNNIVNFLCYILIIFLPFPEEKYYSIQMGLIWNKNIKMLYIYFSGIF